MQWKQAKEELHGGEEEEDDKSFYDLEMLEKKRQKEIEVCSNPPCSIFSFVILSSK